MYSPNDYLGGGVCSVSIFVITSDVVIEPDGREIFPSILVGPIPGLVLILPHFTNAWHEFASTRVLMDPVYEA